MKTDVANTDPTRRVHYVDGLVLGAEDFRAEWAWLDGRDRWLARTLLGSGVLVSAANAPDLTVAVNGTKLVVMPGAAMDRAGQLVCLTQSHDAELTEAFTGESGAELCVYLGYCACPTEAVASTALGTVDGWTPSRLADGARLTLEPRFEPKDNGLQGAAAGPADDGRILLARVTRNGSTYTAHNERTEIRLDQLTVRGGSAAISSGTQALALALADIATLASRFQAGEAALASAARDATTAKEAANNASLVATRADQRVTQALLEIAALREAMDAARPTELAPPAPEAETQQTTTHDGSFSGAPYAALHLALEGAEFTLARLLAIDDALGSDWLTTLRKLLVLEPQSLSTAGTAFTDAAPSSTTAVGPVSLAMNFDWDGQPRQAGYTSLRLQHLSPETLHGQRWFLMRTDFDAREACITGTVLSGVSGAPWILDVIDTDAAEEAADESSPLDGLTVPKDEILTALNDGAVLLRFRAAIASARPPRGFGLQVSRLLDGEQP